MLPRYPDVNDAMTCTVYIQRVTTSNYLTRTRLFDSVSIRAVWPISLPRFGQS